MKFKLLGMNTEDGLNIGDYIQGVAAAQFLPEIDGFIQREKLDEYAGERTTVIMNGWFMHHPEHWPPSEEINPLFVAFHINVGAEKEFLTEESLAYLRRYQPIGCRDLRTCKLLQENNVEAYFSGCLTLTLGEKYLNESKTEDVFFVDAPLVLDCSWRARIKDVWYMLVRYKTSKKLAERYFGNTDLSWRQIKYGASIVRTYNKFLEDKMLRNVHFIKHYLPVSGKDDRYWFEEAESLIRRYAKAALVVTSRIHCALPCLGLGTPVIYIDDPEAWDISSCRLEGLRELFNTLEIRGRKLNPTGNFAPKKITLNSIPHNREDWKKLAKDLTERCNRFIQRQIGKSEI